MKRLVSILTAAAMLAMATGCTSGDHQEVHINLEGNDPLGGEATATTETTAIPVAVNETDVTNKEPTITKSHKIENVSGRATFIYQGKSYEGTLLLTESGFYFTPDEGEEVKFPLNTILLMVVKYQTDASYETLIMFTATDEYEFRAEIGYTNEISKYLLISESSGEY